ncbi:MAG: CRTAC1 family protein [Balneolaceae bacterium]|nr:MAG: CRTAC1 family protein [Balneolaceae bacterium]
MISKLSRRKRKVFWWAVISALLMAIVTAAIWHEVEAEMYLPGQEIEGLTSRLARELPADVPPVQFDNVTEKTGIQFRHFYGERGSRITEDMGSGVAWIDYNNNGFQDLFIVNNSGPMGMSPEEFQNSPAHTKLYRNNGDGTFTDITEEAGLKIRMHGMSTAWADFDNSGFIDCLITGYGENRLFKNNGDGTFTEVTEQAGLGGEYGFWAGAAWGDFNGNGYVDLYITGYLDYFEIPDVAEIRDLQEPPSINPSVFDPIRNLLYMNNGDGTFTEIAEQAGVANAQGKGLEAAWVDLTGNNLPDLYVANDVTDNMLFRNLGNGNFMNISYQAKVADYRGSMGVAIGDWDGDGDLDLFITHWIAQENAFYNNLWSEDGQGMLFFRDEADRYGLGQSSLDYVGWATSFFDFDNDGRPDLFVINGHTNQVVGNPKQLVPMKDQLYWNRNNEEGFYEVSLIAGDYFHEEYTGRGGAYADFNNNGKLDLFIVNHSGPGVLLENRTESGYNWLQVQLTGTDSNRSAIGAKLRLVTRDGVQIKQVGMQPSYLSQNMLVQHFGLKNSENVDELHILWPGGKEQKFTNIHSNQRILITEGNNEVEIWKPTP